MIESDFDEFGQLLDAVCSLLSRGQYRPNPVNTALFFRALARYDLAEVRQALDAHVADPQRGRFVPVPADLIAQIQAAVDDDGRPGAEEAWATSVRCADEWVTVVWCEEMARAWETARHVFENGDEVGARMSFRETYARLVAEARAARRPALWRASVGFDPHQRNAAIEAAITAGRIPVGEAMQLAAPPTFSGPLLTMDAPTGAPAHVIASLRDLAERMRNKETAHRISADAAARARTASLQAQTDEAVRAYVAGQTL